MKGIKVFGGKKKEKSIEKMHYQLWKEPGKETELGAYYEDSL